MGSGLGQLVSGHERVQMWMKMQKLAEGVDGGNHAMASRPGGPGRRGRPQARSCLVTFLHDELVNVFVGRQLMFRARVSNVSESPFQSIPGPTPVTPSGSTLVSVG